MVEEIGANKVLLGPDGLPMEHHWGKSSRSVVEGRFLAGPQRRVSDLRRALGICAEFVRGFRALRHLGPCVTVFGSARFHEDHRYYMLAREMGARLAREGFTVMTGGGPGIMEAANRGAREAGGLSIGCNIELPHEQKHNPYLDRWLEFRHFFVRKVMLIKYSFAFLVMPGGFGTLDEVFETAVLIQTGKISEFPLVLMGKSYWEKLLELVGETLVEEGTISPPDVRLLHLTDSPEEALEQICERARRQFGRTCRSRRHRRVAVASTMGE